MDRFGENGEGPCAKLDAEQLLKKRNKKKIYAIRA